MVKIIGMIIFAKTSLFHLHNLDMYSYIVSCQFAFIDLTIRLLLIMILVNTKFSKWLTDLVL